jgi:hypothetical protein
MIQLSVRCAVPWLYLAFAASALLKLFPGEWSRWLMRNRKYLGLCFAAAMAWQGFFILWLVTVHTDYYVDEVYVLRDAIEGVTGYLFLVAMTATSFAPGRRALSARQWRMLHLTGIYFLWAYAFSVYWWNLFYYADPVVLDHVYYWSGLLAWLLRAFAWAKKELKGVSGTTMPSWRQPLFLTVGGAIVTAGLIASAIGRSWHAPAEYLLTGYDVTRLPELYLPYWPFIAYLPLFAVGFGVYLAARART